MISSERDHFNKLVKKSVAYSVISDVADLSDYLRQMKEDEQVQAQDKSELK